MIKFENISKDELQKLVNESNSLTDILRKLERKTTSGNFRTLKRYAKILNVDLNFILINNKKNPIQSNKIIRNLNEILTINSTYSNMGCLKKRLYNSGLKNKECELCGQNEEWYGKYMSLILDHKNGNHTDNRLENLQILCPNCNATLPTHCGKNIQNKNNKKKHKKIKYIDNVNDPNVLITSMKNKRIFKRPSYEILINNIKEIGYSATGRKYGVTGKTIKNWIKFYEKYGE